MSARSRAQTANNTGRLLFGTAGFPHVTGKGGVAAALSALKSLGLDGMELAFVRSVWMSRDCALTVKDSCEGLFLTAHAPYYINLNSDDPLKKKQSCERISKAARIAYAAGARNLVFHPGFYLKSTHQQAYSEIAFRLSGLRKDLDLPGLTLRPETTGKPSQFGTVEEIIALSRDIPGVLPCIDFSHLYARSCGSFNRRKDFDRVLDMIEKELGSQALKQLHMHVSGIEFGDKGEKKHSTLSLTGFNWKDLIISLAEHGCEGYLICESTNLEEDALTMKEFYETL